MSERERKKLIFLQISFSLSLYHVFFGEERKAANHIFSWFFSLLPFTANQIEAWKRHFSIEKFCALLLIRIYTHFAVVALVSMLAIWANESASVIRNNKWRKNVEANQKAGFDFFIELSFCCAGRLLCEYVQRNKETLAAYLEIIIKLAFL